MLTLRRAIALGLLLAAGSNVSLARQDRNAVTTDPAGQSAVSMGVDGRAVQGPQGLKARRPVPKLPMSKIRPVPNASGRLVVKFRDDVKARLRPDGKIRSAAQRDVSMVNAVLDGCGAICRSSFPSKTEAELAELQARAAAMSGYAQPDLAGIVHLSGNENELLQAAMMLNQMDEVEFVHFEPEYKVYDGVGVGDSGGAFAGDSGGGRPDTDGGDPPPGTVGACCSGGQCFVDTFAQCVAFGGVFNGAGTTCADPWPAGFHCEGACCLDDGSCINYDAVPPVGEAFCGLTLGGSFLGNNTECNLDGPPDSACASEITGACCISETECLDGLTEEQCMTQSGENDTWFEGMDCAADMINCEEPDCGVDGTGSCLVANGSLFCDNEECCQMVCQLDPFCCDENVQWPGRGDGPNWDQWCAALAAQICGGGTPNVLCGSPTAGTCFEANNTPGCADPACCLTVCDLNPACCNISWDAACVTAALELCTVSGARQLPNGDCLELTEAQCLAIEPGMMEPDPTWDGAGTTCVAGLTPDFRPAQGYLTGYGYLDEPGGVPPAIASTLPFSDDGTGNITILPGYEGEGYDLQSLWDVGEVLVDLGAGDMNMTRGRTIKVGVIEHSAFVDWTDPDDPTKNHEDLVGKINPEPNQTIIILSGSQNLSGNHGTACLGIVGAIDHDAAGNPITTDDPPISPNDSHAEEVGCVGIAPEAELYFFPIVSVENPGGRFADAMVSAMGTFGPGDVLSFSIGPGFGTLASTPGDWVLLRMAADLGITCCIAAGNDCFDLGGNPQAGDPAGADPRGDCDAIIVGAVFPGGSSFNSYCRLGFSNHCEACEEADAVHVSAWGEKVATLGYGPMYFPGGDRNRSYTNSFNGTSAACPQVAGLVACLQGMAKQFFGLPLLPAQIRDIVRSNGAGQCGFDQPEQLPGNDAALPCDGDWDFDAPKNRVGVSVTGNTTAYTSPFGAAEALISSGLYDGNPFIDEIVILRGDFVFGNALSVRSDDQNYLVLDSQVTSGGDQPDTSSLPPLLPVGIGIINDVTYIVNGHVSDLLVIGDVTNLQANEITVVGQLQHFGFQGLVFVEMYDIINKRWQFVDFQQLDDLGAQGEDVTFVANVQRARAFIDQEDGRVLARLWTYGFGQAGFAGNGGQAPGGSTGPGYTVRWDLVAIGQGQGFGQIFDP